MNAAENAPAPPVNRKPMAAKEPPAFKWKLTGYVDGLTVTLLKTEEKEEIEAQLKRLEADGYYRGLAIHPIDAKVPPDPLAAKFTKAKKAAPAKAAARTRKTKTSKPAAPAAKAKPKTKSTKKPAKKARGTKSATRTSTRTPKPTSTPKAAKKRQATTPK